MIVAVVDTGDDTYHPDLGSKLIPGRNPYNGNNDTSDVYGHSAMVEDIIGAQGNNGSVREVGILVEAPHAGFGSPIRH